MYTAYLQDLHPERLKPGEQPVQGRLISNRAVQDGFHRLHGGREPLEVKQGFGREDPYYADLVVGRCHRSPLSKSEWATQTSTVLLVGSPRPTHGG